MRAYSSLSKKDLDNADKEVKHALEVGKNEKLAMPRAKYNSYTPEKKAHIDKYALKNSIT